MDGALEPPASIFTVPLQRRKLSDRPVDQCATLKKPARTDASVVAGASAAAREGHFSQHSVKFPPPPQGQVPGEIGPRGLGNGGFREFHVEIRPGRGGQKSAQWASKPPHRRGASVRATRCRRRRSRVPQQCGMVPGLHASQAHSRHRRPRRPASSVRSRRWQGGTTPS